jgi:hypothetical protein
VSPFEIVVAELPSSGKGRQPVAAPEAEEAWLPRLGPTAMCLLRWADRRLAESPTATVAVSSTELARALGIHHHKVASSLVRLHQFRFAWWDPSRGLLAVLRSLPRPARRAA